MDDTVVIFEKYAYYSRTSTAGTLCIASTFQPRMILSRVSTSALQSQCDCSHRSQMQQYTVERATILQNTTSSNRLDGEVTRSINERPSCSYLTHVESLPSPNVEAFQRNVAALNNSII